MYLRSFAKDQVCFDASKLWTTPTPKGVSKRQTRQSLRSENAVENSKPDQLSGSERYRTHFGKETYLPTGLRVDIVPVELFSAVAVNNDNECRSSSMSSLYKGTELGIRCPRESTKRTHQKTSRVDSNNNDRERYIWLLPKTGGQHACTNIPNCESYPYCTENENVESHQRIDNRSNFTYSSPRPCAMKDHSKHMAPEHREKLIHFRKFAIIHQPTSLTTLPSLPLLQTNYYQEYTKYHVRSQDLSDRWRDSDHKRLSEKGATRLMEKCKRRSTSTSSRTFENPCEAIYRKCFGMSRKYSASSSDSGDYGNDSRIYLGEAENSDDSSDDDGGSDTDVGDDPDRDEDEYGDSCANEPSDVDDSSGGDSASSSCCDMNSNSFPDCDFDDEVMEQEEQTLANFLTCDFDDDNSGYSDCDMGPDSFGDSEEFLYGESDEDSGHYYRTQEID